MAKFGFDTAEVDINERASRDPIPEGTYTLKATEAVEKETRNRDGSYIAVTFEVVRGDFAGRKLWSNFNIHNKSDKAQRIGRQQIMSWAAACGKLDADDTDKLVDLPFSADVYIEEARDGYAASNDIRSFNFDAPEKTEKAEKPAAKAAPKPAAKAAEKAANPWD
jgi:hypothetical protein